MCHTTKRTSVSYTQHQKCALLSEECEHVSKCFQLKAAATKSSIASSSQWGMWAHVSKCFWTLLLLAARGKRSAPYHRHTWNHHKKYFQGQECKITWEGVILGVSTITLMITITITIMQNYLGRSDTGCVNSSDWKTSVLLDSLASVADPGHNYWSHDNHCHNQRDPLRNHCHN